MNYDNTKVSLELRDLIENGVKIFDFDYQYNGLDKDAFEQKVIDHYYFRQIGQETVGRFKHYFKTRILEIMPYYNQLFDSEKLMAQQGDPFEAYNLTETFTRELTNENKTTTSGSTSSNTTLVNSGTTTTEVDTTKKYSDTPQGNVGNLDDGYLTNVTKDDGTTTETLGTEHTNTGSDTTEGETDQNGKTSETYTMTRKGNIGVQPFGQEIKIYRESFLNIDLMIIKELNDLFLMVY